MRSPWQLIKGFALRRKSDDAGASVHEAVPTPDPRGEVFEQSQLPKRELEAHPDTKPQSLTEGYEIDRRPASIGADAQQPLPAVQPGPLPLQVADNVAPGGHLQFARVAPTEETIDREGATGTVTNGSSKRRAKAVKARESLGKRTVVKTAVDEAVELDLEIKDLRLQLSAKLLEQNIQLRRMIERYGDR